MIRKIIMVMLIVFFIMSGVSAFAESAEIAVLHNGNTEINRNTFKFMKEQLAELGSPYKLIPEGNGSEISPDTYSAILILNTGVESGLDPEFLDFINSWKNKSEILIISLIKGSSDFEVRTAVSLSAAPGVDTITAASQWKKSALRSLFGKNNNKQIMQMHEEWFKKVITFIENQS